MVRAYPTDENGIRNGATRSFSDIQWATLNRMGKHRWVEAINEKPCVTVELLTSEKEAEQDIEEIIDTSHKKTRKRVTKKKHK